MVTSQAAIRSSGVVTNASGLHPCAEERRPGVAELHRRVRHRGCHPDGYDEDAWAAERGSGDLRL